MVIAAAAFFVYRALDPNQYREQIAAEVKRLTGRELLIGGDLRLALSLNPTFEARDIGLSNAEWAAEESLLHIGVLKVKLALRPLLSGDVRIQSIEADGVTLSLETNASGQGNWELQTPAASAGETTFSIDTVALRNVEIRRRAPDGSAAAYLVRALEFHPQILIDGVSFKQLSMAIAQGTYTGNITFTSDNDQQHLLGELMVDTVQFADSRDTKREQPSKRKAQKLFSDSAFDVHIPPTLTTDIALKVGSLTIDNVNLANLSTQITTLEGTLELNALSADIDGGHISSQFKLETAHAPPRWALVLSGKKLDAGKLLRSGNKQWLKAHGDLSLDVQSSGGSLAQIMKNLTGTGRWLIGQGSADLEGVDELVGGLSTALGTLFTEDAKSTHLNCSIGDFKITKGIATSQLLLADSQHSTVYGTGHVDLRNEKLKLVLKPEPKSITLNVAVPVEVGGTLASPTFTPEKLGVARKAGGILAAVGAISFPPAIVLGLGELGTGEDNPCLTLASTHTSGQVKPDAKRQNGQKGNVIERAADDVGDALKSAGGAIRGLFD